MYNILIADDESIVRRGIKTLVDYKALGIDEVFEAENGQTALDIIRSGTVHILFADINMPKMNGLDLVRAAKQQDVKLKIALITGYDYFDYVLTALRLGVDDYILKPISKDDITELLIKLIDKRKAEDGLDSIRTATDKILQLSGDRDENSLKNELSDRLLKNIENPNFSLSELAKEVGYSVPYLSTLFKKSFGSNFRDYLLEQRLERAKLLLLSTSMKNYEVGIAIGMQDANYFSACFKRKYGVTISEFRSMGGKS